jgi:hypothetical protein
MRDAKVRLAISKPHPDPPRWLTAQRRCEERPPSLLVAGVVEFAGSPGRRRLRCLKGEL